MLARDIGGMAAGIIGIGRGVATGNRWSSESKNSPAKAGLFF
jgi:hypothetical protein